MRALSAVALPLIAAALVSCSGHAAVSTPTPLPTGTPVPTQPPIGGTGPIVALGDSLTYGYGDGVTLAVDGPAPAHSYPWDVQRDLHVPVINAGVSGTSAHEVLDPASEANHPRPVNLQLAALLALHPRLMVVMFGTTEAIRGYPISRTICDLHDLLARIDAAHVPTLIVATHVDCTQHPECSPPPQVYTTAWDQALIPLAAEFNAGLVLDVENGFPPGLLTDWIHCNALGYQVMAQRIEVGIRARLGNAPSR
jgi:lysophospholipase L1-like esterase